MNDFNETSVSRRRFLVKGSAAALAAGIAAQSTNTNFQAPYKTPKSRAAKSRKLKLRENTGNFIIGIMN